MALSDAIACNAFMKHGFPLSHIHSTLYEAINVQGLSSLPYILFDENMVLNMLNHIWL